MRRVAAALIQNQDERLLTAQRLNHPHREVQLLGGVMRMGEQASDALKRTLAEDLDVDRRVKEQLGQVATWRTLHYGEPTSFEIYHVALPPNIDIHAREDETHSDLAWRSTRELKGMNMAPDLGQVVRWLEDGELKW